MSLNLTNTLVVLLIDTFLLTENTDSLNMLRFSMSAGRAMYIYAGSLFIGGMCCSAHRDVSQSDMMSPRIASRSTAVTPEVVTAATAPAVADTSNRRDIRHPTVDRLGVTARHIVVATDTSSFSKEEDDNSVVDIDDTNHTGEDDSDEYFDAFFGCPSSRQSCRYIYPYVGAFFSTTPAIAFKSSVWTFPTTWRYGWLLPSCKVSFIPPPLLNHSDWRGVVLMFASAAFVMWIMMETVPEKRSTNRSSFKFWSCSE